MEVFLVATLVPAALVVGFFAAPGLDAALLATALPGDGFFAAPLWAAAFFTGTFFAGVFFAGAFFAGAFGTRAFFTGAFFGAAFFATTFFTTTFLAGADFFAELFAGAAFLVADFGEGFFATDFAEALTVDLLALFTFRSLVVAAFELPAWTAALADVSPSRAFAPVEPALLFTISVHHGQPWWPRVIADVFYTSKSVSGILVPSHAACHSCNVNILARLILSSLRLYKRWLSPLLGSRCRFHPTCSDYARIAVTRFGPLRGSLLVAWRLLRCQPLCDGGEDPVPERFQFTRCHAHGHAGEHPDM